jgi:hypothetical protein
MSSKDEIRELAERHIRHTGDCPMSVSPKDFAAFEKSVGHILVKTCRCHAMMASESLASEIRALVERETIQQRDATAAVVAKDYEQRIELMEREKKPLLDALNSIACLAGEGPEVYSLEGKSQSRLIDDILKEALAALREQGR